MSEEPEASSAPDSSAAAPSAPEFPLASLGDRLVAQLVDGAVGFGLFFFVGMVLAPRFGGATETGFNLTGAPALAVMSLAGLLFFAYFVLAEGSLGATLGKLVAGIRVQRAAGGRASLGGAAIRNLLRLVDGIALYLVGAIVVLITKRNQRVGDLAAGTIVVQMPWGRPVRAGALALALLVAAGGVVGGFVLREPPPPPRLTSVILTDDRNNATPKSVFPATTRGFFVLFTVANVPENTLLKGVWTAESVPPTTPDTTIDEAELRVGGERNQGNFSLVRSVGVWPAGTYRVDLYLNQQLAHTERFTVEAVATPSPTPRASPVAGRTATPTPRASPTAGSTATPRP